MNPLLNGKRIECTGEIIFDGGTARVDCKRCRGTSDLGNPECFKGLARRITPGFNGEIVLRSSVERGFRGPVVEALTAYSDILSILDSMIERRKVIFFGRVMTNELGSLRDSFMEDPSSIIRDEDRFRSKLKRSGNRNGPQIMKAFDDIVERTSLMIRKLEHNSG